ncbi:MAG: FAD-dependent oxidoreductase [Mesorhizobium sp.]|nr:FAD-dependent oxidoreductase [Mesorhizobium sp.]
MINRVLIAGSGQGGFQAAASLRQEGFEGEIVLLGDEPGLPYQRPPLSKTYLKEGNGDRLLFRNADFFEKNAIRLEDGRRLAAIDRMDRGIVLDDGRRLAYDHLILALGARNRRLPLPGIDLANVLNLRTLADADIIRAHLAASSSLVVIGGGFIGLEIAATARAIGLHVTVLEATARLMSRVVSQPISDYFLAAHRGSGVDIRLNALAARIVDDGAGRVCEVELAGGERIAADLVLVSAGVLPNAEIAEAAGLYVHDGIRVNDLLATEDAAISAIGDCASFPFGHDGIQTRLESVQNAVDQAKCVARRLVGHAEPYAKVPWFWSDQAGDKLQMAGLTAGADHHVVRGSHAEGRLSVLCFRREELVGVETVNVGGDHMAARRLLGWEEPLTLERAQSAAFDLAALMKAGA